MKKGKVCKMENTNRKPFKFSFIILFWVVMAMGIGGLIWLVRTFIIIQNQGYHMAVESNSLILTSEIVFLSIGVILSIFMMFKISKLLLERIIYE